MRIKNSKGISHNVAETFLATFDKHLSCCMMRRSLKLFGSPWPWIGSNMLTNNSFFVAKNFPSTFVCVCGDMSSSSIPTGWMIRRLLETPIQSCWCWLTDGYDSSSDWKKRHTLETHTENFKCCKLNETYGSPCIQEQLH